MSGNTSATGGFLTQQNTPLSDQALEDAITAAVRGIIGLPDGMVRPRWQPIPPKQPAPSVNWAAVGITERIGIDYPVIRHFNGGPDRLTRWSSLLVMISIYGPGCQGLAEQLRDGFYIAQNGEQLGALNIKIIDVGKVTAVPDLFNMQWINRSDLSLRLAQAVDRDYAVLDLASSQGFFTADDNVTTEWDVNP